MGSIVCYLTGLSHIDPIANNLFLGRFLNRDMASVPDIDLDFPRDIRERLIAEVIRRYGHEHAALVAAFPTFKARMAIRELGKALALPEADLTRLSRLADGWSDAGDLRQELLRLPDGAAKLRSPTLAGADLFGRPGRGPAAPPVPAFGRDGRQRPAAGGAGTGRAGRHTRAPDLPMGQELLRGRRVREDRPARARHALGRRGVRRPDRPYRPYLVDLSRIDFSDPEVYAEIQAADTVGTFQIESRAQMQSLLQTRPENLDDLTVQVALIRPGPVSGGAVHPYVQHRRARRADPDFVPPYDHPLLEPALRETLGVVVFQEQVLEVAWRWRDSAPAGRKRCAGP